MVGVALWTGCEGDFPSSLGTGSHEGTRLVTSTFDATRPQYLSFQGCVVLYEFVVPEEKRLHYKYREKHGHHELDHVHH